MKGDLRIELDPVSYMKANEALNKLSKIEGNKMIRKALTKGSRPIIAQGKKNLASRNKVRKGNLKSSFKSSVRSKWRKIYMGFRRPQGAASHLIDKGTKNRWTKKGQFRGKVKGSRFWIDAVQQKAPKSLEKLMSVINDEIKKIVG